LWFAGNSQDFFNQDIFVGCSCLMGYRLRPMHYLLQSCV